MRPVRRVAELGSLGHFTRMWICPKCNSEVEDDYFECWKCSSPKQGVDDRVAWFEAIDSVPLVIPESLLNDWHGAEPSAPGIPGQDLEGALAVDGWIGAIAVGSGQALVLNDTPTTAGFFVRDGSLCILRWLCADSVNDLLELVESDSPLADSSPPVSFTHLGGRLCLIGAGDCGSELEYQPSAMELAAGRYSVTTCIMKKPRTEVLIHRFDHVA
jgi:hypothetical protein